MSYKKWKIGESLSRDTVRFQKKGDGYYSGAISTLAEVNILKGYKDGTFRPRNNIICAEVAAIISRLLDELEKIETDKFPFNDVYETYWTRPYS